MSFYPDAQDDLGYGARLVDSQVFSREFPRTVVDECVVRTEVLVRRDHFQLAKGARDSVIECDWLAVAAVVRRYTSPAPSTTRSSTRCRRLRSPAP
jgi:hypothetical protein